MEYSYKSLNDLPARTIQGMLESAIIEIARLQREVDRLTADNTKLITPAETPKPKKDEG